MVDINFLLSYKSRMHIRVSTPLQRVIATTCVAPLPSRHPCLLKLFCAIKEVIPGATWDLILVLRFINRHRFLFP